MVRRSPGERKTSPEARTIPDHLLSGRYPDAYNGGDGPIHVITADVYFYNLGRCCTPLAFAILIMQASWPPGSWVEEPSGTRGHEVSRIIQNETILIRIKSVRYCY